MKRKVNRVGQNTLTVSLPSKWAKKYGVNVGDELEVVEEGGSLLVGAKVTLLKKEINVKILSSKYEFVKALIRNLYIHGFEKVKINYNSKLNYTYISKAVNELSGFEIIKETDKDCIIETISEIKSDKFTLFYNKLFQIAITILEILEKGLKERANKVDQSIVDELSKKSSKYACICRRGLVKNKLMNNDYAIVIMNNINLTHMIIRRCATCYKYILNNKVIGNQDSIGFLKEVTLLFNELYKLHLKKIDESLNITEKREHLIERTLPNLLTRNGNKNGFILHSLAMVVQLIGTMAPKIALMNEFYENQVEKDF